MPAFVYILRCRDGSYYVGSTRSEDVARRLHEHQTGAYGGYTSTRLPVELVWSDGFERISDAVAFERQVKGWSRAKKEALIAGDWERLPALGSRPKREK
jgi:putative endonuclease